MLRSFVGIIVFLSFSTALAIHQTAPIPNYTVVSCNDGDTCKVRSNDNVTIKIRLVAIDAPERGKYEHREKSVLKKWLREYGILSGGPQPLAEKATEYLNSLVKDKQITVQIFGTDAFGRNLGVLFLNDLNVNLAMVQEGFAEVYQGKKPPALDITPYLEAQQEAQQRHIGIWALERYESPTQYRRKNRS